MTETPQNDIRDRSRAPAALVLVALVVFAPVLFGGRTMYPTDITNELFLPFAAHSSHSDVQATSLNDYVMYYYPARAFEAASLRSGHLNLWNPLVLGGHPAFASSAATVTLDPFNVLLFLPNLGLALAWRSFLQEVACLLFMFMYLRHLGLSRAAAVAGSLAYGFNSMFWVNIFDWSIAGMLWLPLICLLVDRAVEKPSARSVGAAGLAFGVALLASPLQIYMYLCFGVTAVTGLRWWTADQSRRPLTSAVATLAAVGVIGVAMSAIQLAPTLELLAHSDRFASGPMAATRRPTRTLEQTAIATGALVTFVFPNLGGRVKDSMQLSGALWNGELHWQGYVGVVPFVFAVVAAAASRDRRRLAYLGLGVGVVALILYTPLGRVLYERGFLLYIFCAAVLSAFGVHAIERGDVVVARARVAVRWLLVLFGLVLLGLAGFTIADMLIGVRIERLVDARVSASLAGNYLGQSYPELYRQKAEQFIHDLRLWSPHAAIPLVAAFGAAGVVTAALRRAMKPATLAVTVIVMTAAELAFMTWTHVPLVDVARYPFVPASPAIEVLRADHSRFRVLTYRGERDAPILPLGLTAMYGVASADGYDDLGPPDLARLIRVDHAACGDAMCAAPHGTEIANVKYVMTGPTTVLPSDRFALEYDRDVRIYRSLNVRPRAMWAASYEVQPDTAAALARARSDEFAGVRTVILEAPPAARPRREGAEARIEMLSDEATRVELRVRADDWGFVVLSDTFYPGWDARLDGRPVPILRANGVMRGVEVGPGDHMLSFDYQPASLRYGAWISGTALVIAVGGVLAGRRRR